MCAKPTGFLEFERRDPSKRPKEERVQDFREVEKLMPRPGLQEQAARCMDCGVPFCHSYGCPLHNLIPDFNDMVYRGKWRKALDLLHLKNNFPEITGRICPAPCETACTLAINQDGVTIRQIELQIVEHGWKSGWIQPEPAERLTGRRVAVVGSGPAGLAAAQQLARKGHKVVVFEKDAKPGGILRYGIPDFKLEKWVLDRRLEQLSGEGVTFETGVAAGTDISIGYLRRSFDAVLLSGGARVPRDLGIPGRELKGIHFAMEFLGQQNRVNGGESVPDAERILATGKRVVVLGGGDTGADCVGTCHRQKAREVAQLEILPKPPPTRDSTTPWPQWPYQLRSSSSHEEGGERRWSVQTKTFVGQDGRVSGLRAIEVEWGKDASGRMQFQEQAGTEFDVPADLVLLALGFTKDGNARILRDFGLATDAQGNATVDRLGMSSVQGVFVAGDLSAGASLVVRAIADGRRVAEGINDYLMYLSPAQGGP
ncbi:MAG: glutamate synthase [Lentisphaerae bacterium RIFOXYB12_FULL_65_16]|nr:MAG: glutamate synthase [Lentisphaerae bacterium RIFOXYA12_64_32]OGV84589.1 MAG: glutamate synthase [Lentisphaerae bacterium RIFOXYB12_FULL_65_16]